MNLKNVKEKFLAYWQGLDAREKKYIRILGIFGGCAAFLFLYAKPFMLGLFQKSRSVQEIKTKISQTQSQMELGNLEVAALGKKIIGQRMNEMVLNNSVAILMAHLGVQELAQGFDVVSITMPKEDSQATDQPGIPPPPPGMAATQGQKDAQLLWFQESKVDVQLKATYKQVEALMTHMYALPLFQKVEHMLIKKEKDGQPNHTQIVFRVISASGVKK